MLVPVLLGRPFTETGNPEEDQARWGNDDLSRELLEEEYDNDITTE